MFFLIQNFYPPTGDIPTEDVVPQIPVEWSYYLFAYWLIYTIASGIFYCINYFSKSIKSAIKIPYPEPKEKRIFLDDLFDALIVKHLKWQSLLDYTRNIFGLLFIKSKNLRFIIYTGGFLLWMKYYLMSSMPYIKPFAIYFFGFLTWFINLNFIWQVLFHICVVIFIIKRIQKKI